MALIHLGDQLCGLHMFILEWDAFDKYGLPYTGLGNSVQRNAKPKSVVDAGD